MILLILLKLLILLELFNILLSTSLSTTYKRPVFQSIKSIKSIIKKIFY